MPQEILSFLLTSGTDQEQFQVMTEKGTALSLFMADDHKIVGDGLRLLIEREPGLHLVGEAADGRALVEGVLALRPDLVITDIAMPELNGLEAVRQIRAAGYAGIIVVLSMHSDRRFVSEALAAGINAYVLKDYAFTQVLSAIAVAQTGKVWLSPQLHGMVENGEVPTLTMLLSVREREVLQLLAEGHGTKEVAYRLQLSPKTVETHRLSLFSKLKVGGIADLVRIAVQEGLVKL
jgi:DNA-binding NarL/FixJ family response regulator